MNFSIHFQPRKLRKIVKVIKVTKRYKKYKKLKNEMIYKHESAVCLIGKFQESFSD